MADAEQVSSTTPNEVEEDEMKPWREAGFREAPAQDLVQDGNVGLFAGEQDVHDVQDVPEVQKAHVEAAGEVIRQEEMDLLHTPENKAETECLEKSVDLISKPVECESPEEPDSTQIEDEITAVEEEAVREAEEDTEEALNLLDLKDSDVQAFTQVKQDQDPVVSSATELQEAFRSAEIQEQLMTTKLEEEIFFKSEPEPQDQDFHISARVKEEAFSAPVEYEKAVSSVVEEKKEPERRTQVEERFRVDSESTPAASASPSAHEPSLPSSAVAAASFPTLMQFTSVVELLYWRDVKNSGIVFGASLLLLLSLSVCSIISVLSYVALALLSVTISFRIYKGVLQAIQKSDEGHPFKLYLEQDVSLPDEVVRKYSDVALSRINAAINELRRLFLVEDLVDSLKFAVLMWILTYVGALFNGLTLLILGLVAMFTCPVVYEKHQAQIDHYIALVRNQVKDIVEKIQAKIPGAKKKVE
ncbi:reticulon-4b isoform X2 [Pangasianodon hypophthalmus]|uniref:reticulon-4b isoform X2 n=1 Tax=Pangasianodon hypophthalmus TaxID=310915 RepID=UPI000EFE065E|nr:reticulon-4b isoform X2 [Pangasianodon hypophthalmus]